MDTIWATIRALSVLVGALSAVSFVQTLFDIGLVSTLQAVITFYRDIASTVFGVPAALLGLKPPQAVVDFWTVSFLGAGAYVRTQGIERCRAFRSYEWDPQSPWWKIAVLLAFGFSGLGAAVVLGVVWPLTYADDFHEEPLDLMKGAARNVMLVLAGAFAFFVVNAFVPSG